MALVLLSSLVGKFGDVGHVTYDTTIRNILLCMKYKHNTTDVSF